MAIPFAVAEMLNWTWVRMNLGRKAVPITLTAKTYTLPSTITEIEDVTIGTRKEPITPFWSVASFNKWLFEQLGDNDPPVVDTDNTAERYHVFNRANDGSLIITFEPGIGTDTTATIWHLGRIQVPYQVDVLPENLHGYLYLVAVNYATGFAYEQAVERIKGIVSTRVTQVLGALEPAPQDPLIERRAELRNGFYQDF
jgi:hypothetical protein